MGVSAPSLHRESTDSLIFTMFAMYICCTPLSFVVLFSQCWFWFMHDVYFSLYIFCCFLSLYVFLGYYLVYSLVCAVLLSSYILSHLALLAGPSVMFVYGTFDISSSRIV